MKEFLKLVKQFLLVDKRLHITTDMIFLVQYQRIYEIDTKEWEY